MNRKQWTVSLVLASVYFILFAYLSSLTMTVDIPEWWYPTFGRNNVSAVAWMQIVHSLGVILGAIPIAGLLVLSFKPNWNRMALTIALLASLVMLLDVSLGFWRMRQFEVELFAPWKVASALLDVIKLGGIFFLAAWVIQKVVPSNNALH